jgi:ribosomal protein S18 acetylase RimI-like enzyme
MSITPGRVRRARIDDVPGIATVHVRSWQAAYKGLLPQDYLDRLDPADRVTLWRNAVLNADWPGRGVLVAVLDGTLCGFAGFGPTRDADGDPRRTGEVYAIYLHPAAWSKGFGRDLMTGALASLAGAGYAQATLWVLDSNARARQFYANAGWAQDGAVTHDDSDGFAMTEVRYRRQLP